MLANSDQKILAQDVKSDMDKVLSKMKKARGKSERFHLGKEMKQLRKELRDREKRAMKETLIRWLSIRYLLRFFDCLEARASKPKCNFCH